jgi:glycosyltransferase involved in cell wall biosynthesis
MPKATIIAAFYNKVDYLKLVLAGFERQTEKNFEFILADDGSSSDVVEEIERISHNYSFPIIHIWQEDKGFRKNKILNRGIAAASSEYLVFIDADCIPHPRFVEEHILNAMQDVCLTGRRVNLSSEFTSRLTPDLISRGFLDTNKIKIILDGISGRSSYVEKGFYFQNKILRKVLNTKKRGILGSNFSLFKNNFIKINGFDERYIAPSIGEDTDVQFRLELIGVKIISVNHITVQYHLFHKLQERLQKNLALFERIKEGKTAFTPFGLDQS